MDVRSYIVGLTKSYITCWSDKVQCTVLMSNKVILQKTIWKVGSLCFAARNQTNFAIWSEVWNKTILYVNLWSIFMIPAVYDTKMICLVKDDDLYKLPLFYPPNVAWKTCQFRIFAQLRRSGWDEIGAGTYLCWAGERWGRELVEAWGIGSS